MPVGGQNRAASPEAALASARNHDVMLYCLLGYVEFTGDYGLYGAGTNPCLHLLADADLAGDVMARKSHSGRFVAEEDVPINMVLRLTIHSETQTILREDNSAVITVLKSG